MTKPAETIVAISGPHKGRIGVVHGADVYFRAPRGRVDTVAIAPMCQIGSWKTVTQELLRNIPLLDSDAILVGERHGYVVGDSNEGKVQVLVSMWAPREWPARHFATPIMLGGDVEKRIGDYYASWSQEIKSYAPIVIQRVEGRAAYGDGSVGAFDKGRIVYRPGGPTVDEARLFHEECFDYEVVETDIGYQIPLVAGDKVELQTATGREWSYVNVIRQEGNEVVISGGAQRCAVDRRELWLERYADATKVRERLAAFREAQGVEQARKHAIDPAREAAALKSSRVVIPTDDEPVRAFSALPPQDIEALKSTMVPSADELVVPAGTRVGDKFGRHYAPVRGEGATLWMQDASGKQVKVGACLGIDISSYEPRKNVKVLAPVRGEPIENGKTYRLTGRVIAPEPTEGERLAAFFGKSQHEGHPAVRYERPPDPTIIPRPGVEWDAVPPDEPYRERYRGDLNATIEAMGAAFREKVAATLAKRAVLDEFDMLPDAGK